MEACMLGLEWVDSLLRHLMVDDGIRDSCIVTVLIGPPEGHSLFSPHHTPLVMQPGGTVIPASLVAGPRDCPAPPLDPINDDLAACPVVVRPRQSFQQVGGESLADLDTQSAVLCLRRLPGVVRQDRLGQASVKESWNKAGQGVILIDRLLHEIAYKLGRAAKYGA